MHIGGVTTNPWTCWSPSPSYVNPTKTKMKDAEGSGKWKNVSKKIEAVNKLKAHSFPLLPQKTSLFLKVNITVKLLAHTGTSLVYQTIPLSNHFKGRKKLSSHYIYFTFFSSFIWIIFQILIYPTPYWASLLLQTTRPCEGELLKKHTPHLFTNWVHHTLQQFGNKLGNSHEGMMRMALIQLELILGCLIWRKETFLNQPTTGARSRQHVYASFGNSTQLLIP